MVRTFHRSKPVEIIMWSMSFIILLRNRCFTILFYGAFFLLSVMVEGDESSRLRMTNWPAVLASYWSLLTALVDFLAGHETF